jgi:hypothetical protein
VQSSDASCGCGVDHPVKLRFEQITRGVKSGIASSVIKQQWAAAEIYPSSANARLTVTSQQAEQLKLSVL